jgi:hypothetical protein
MFSVGREKYDARRVSMEVRKDVFGPCMSPFGSLVKMTLVGWMWRAALLGIWSWAVVMVFHLKVFSSHRGARCLKSLLEYCRVLQCCLTILSCNFVPIRPCIEQRFSCLVWSTDCDASLMLVTISFSCCRTGRLSNSRPGIALARRRIRRVGNLSEGVLSLPMVSG